MPHDRAPGPPTDEVRLRHMLDAARSVQRFCDGRTRQSLDQDEMLTRAVLHALLEIGEAASKVTDPVRSLAPSLPWGQIVATRNILVHVYWGVDFEKIWRTVREDIPALIAAVEIALARLASQAPSPGSGTSASD